VEEVLAEVVSGEVDLEVADWEVATAVAWAEGDLAEWEGATVGAVAAWAEVVAGVDQHPQMNVCRDAAAGPGSPFRR
jgi:hypothetical protein